MAFEIGIADNFRDLLKRVVTFVTTDATLVGLGQNWALSVGEVSTDALEYVDNTNYNVNGLLTWDKCVAMGANDDFNDSYQSYDYKGWVAYVVDMPNQYLGYESTISVLPSYYKITAENWDTGTSLGSRQPKDWDVEYSDNGTDWVLSDSVRDETTWSLPAEVRQYSISAGSGAHKFWRLRFIANQGDATHIVVGRLRFYSSGGSWISQSYSPEYQLRAPGYSGVEEIYCGIRLHENYVSDWHNWELMGAIAYDPSVRFHNQPQSLETRGVQLWQFSIPYWLVANGQRLILVAKVSTTYQCMYLGKFLPYATPSQYPYPLLVSGSRASTSIRWSESGSAYHRSIQCPSEGSYFYSPGNTWQIIQNRYQSSSDVYRGGSGYGYMMPTHSSSLGASNNMTNVLANPDGSFVLTPYVLIGQNIPSTNNFGELEGLFWVSGNSNPAENIISVGSQEYLVFQNIYRTSWRDYAALELK